MRQRVLMLSVNRCVTPDPVFPLGLAHLTAALRNAGHDVRWWDAQCSGDSIESMIETFRPQVVGISLRNIDDVLIQRQQTFFEDAASVIARIRERSTCPIVVGGSGFSIFPQRLLDLTGADFGIQGEGEESFKSLIAALAAGAAVDDIAGLVYRRDGRLRVNPPACAPPQSALADEDRPAWATEHYLSTAGMLNVQTQRGCAHTCCYCTYPLIEGRRHRRRSPEAVAEEMTRLEARGVRYVFIVDSIFNSSEQHVVETCEAIRSRGLRLRWGCFLRPEGITPALMRTLRDAGLAHAEFGSDSFADGVLAEYGKRFTFADIRAAHDAARTAGVEVCHFLICGGPGETLETLDEGYRNSLLLDGGVIVAMVGMRIYPGTALHARALREGRIQDETDLLNPVYYLALGLTTESVFGRLSTFGAQSSNWIVGEPGPDYGRFVQRLRHRGVSGPLWTYFALLQRFHRAPSETVAVAS